MRARQHNAHVMARKRLITRIVDRRYDWGMRDLGRLDMMQIRACAALALSRYKWSPDWSVRQTGRYHAEGGYDGPRVLYKRVPTTVLHSCMCSMRAAAKELGWLS